MKGLIVHRRIAKDYIKYFTNLGPILGIVEALIIVNRLPEY